MLATDHDDLAMLREAGAEAGRIAMRHFRADPQVWMKAGQSPVSEADYAVDTFLRETLMAARPDYGWLSEETVDTSERLDKRRTFVVDPIDGTRGYLEGRDKWCVSIAVVEDGRPTVGVLVCPARNETFWASRGGGAFRDDVVLNVRPVGMAPEVAGPKVMVDAMPEGLRETLRRVHHIPSLAYRIVMIANSAIDATFVKPHAQDWDLAAADLILSEAGGAIRNGELAAPLYGSASTAHGALVAGSGAILDIMASVIASAGQAVSNRADLS